MPPCQRPTQPAPPGTAGKDRENDKNTVTDGIHLKESERYNFSLHHMPAVINLPELPKSASTIQVILLQATGMLPPPPPPPGLAPKPISDQFDATPSEAISISGSGINDSSKTMPLPLPPPRHPPPMPQRLPLAPSLQSDVLPPGMVRYPPPLPPDMKPPLPVHGIPNQLPLPPPPLGMVPPSLARQQFAGLPGLPAALRPMASGIPFKLEDDLAAYKHSAPQKPSHGKSAASTVVKRPLAQHTPELTAMVLASVRVKRVTAVQKMKPKPQLPASSSTPRPLVGLVVAGKPEAAAAPSAPKGQSIDDSYMAFLEDMKALGALDS